MNAITRAELLVQIRAADAIGDTLSSEAERAKEQVDALSKQINEVGGARAFAAFKPTPDDEKQLDYRDLFAGVSQAAEKLETQSAEGSTANLTDMQLFQEMTTLQSHNLRQFVRVNELRERSDSMRQFLHVVGKWSGPATTQPAIAKPSDLLATARQRVAQQPSDQWTKRRTQVRNAISARIEAIRQYEANATAGRQQQQQFSLSSAGLADDPRFSRYFYGVEDGWSGWNADFSDAFEFSGGGGYYRRHDTRVNRDSDPRIQGQYDRRLNIESDRRLNVHSDPRDNF